MADSTYFVDVSDWPSRTDLTLTTGQVYEALDEITDGEDDDV